VAAGTNQAYLHHAVITNFYQFDIAAVSLQRGPNLIQYRLYLFYHGILQDIFGVCAKSHLSIAPDGK